MKVGLPKELLDLFVIHLAAPFPEHGSDARLELSAPQLARLRSNPEPVVLSHQGFSLVPPSRFSTSKSREPSLYMRRTPSLDTEKVHSAATSGSIAS